MEPRGVGEDFFCSVCFLRPSPREGEWGVRLQNSESFPSSFLVRFFFSASAKWARGIGVLFFFFVVCLFGLLKLERAEGCIFGGKQEWRIFFFVACLIFQREPSEEFFFFFLLSPSQRGQRVDIRREKEELACVFGQNDFFTKWQESWV